MKLPDKLFGMDVVEEYEKYLAGAKDVKEPIKENKIITPANIQNPEAYLILEGKTHGSYSYPDLLVSMEKYHHGKNWEQAHEALHKDNAFMLTIRQFVDFLELLKSGKAHNGKGDKIDNITLDKILDEILTVRNPWRAEWLNAKFTKQKDKLCLCVYDPQFKSTFAKNYGVPLEDCLMEDKTPGIDLDSWIKSATSQGLPIEKTKGGSLYYWYPRENAVARFYAGYVRAVLGCFRGPGGSNPSLGVRLARKK